MAHGSATNSHFPSEETPLTTDSSSANAGVCSYPASAMMAYSVNSNAALHLGGAVPSHLLTGTTKHSWFFIHQVLQRYK